MPALAVDHPATAAQQGTSSRRVTTIYPGAAVLRLYPLGACASAPYRPSDAENAFRPLHVESDIWRRATSPTRNHDQQQAHQQCVAATLRGISCNLGALTEVG